MQDNKKKPLYMNMQIGESTLVFPCNDLCDACHYAKMYFKEHAVYKDGEIVDYYKENIEKYAEMYNAIADVKIMYEREKAKADE